MDRTHQEAISSICSNDIADMDNFNYINGALAVAEQERWPRIGLSITRRALNLLAHDEKIQCLVCFVCARTRTTCAGYPTVNLKSTTGAANSYHTEINHYKEANLCDLEREHPGTLMNNSSYELWRRRYSNRSIQSSSRYPWSHNHYR